MRQYRGKQIDNGEWVFGNLLTNGKEAVIADYISWGIGVCYECASPSDEFDLVDPKTVGQYIGIDDINKVQMYEGDIILVKLRRWDKPDEVIASGKAVIEFRQGCFGFEWADGSVKGFTTFRNFTRTTFEVIGNVHDKPELIEQ